MFASPNLFLKRSQRKASHPTRFAFPSPPTSRPSVNAQQRPQPLSVHALASRFSGYPGGGGLPPFSVSSAPSVLEPTRSSVLTDPFCTHRPTATVPFRMRSFKTQDLKPFRMCGSEKTWEGEGPLFNRSGLLVSSQSAVSGKLSASQFPLYPVTVLELDCGQDFDPTRDEDFFAALPPKPAVCLIESRAENAEPFLIRTQDLRRRLQRLLGPPDPTSKRLNLRELAR